MSERKLARIELIDKIEPIPGADAIECATILGWTVVVKKGEFKPGDKCVFFEIDSFLPLSDPRYAFLAKNAIKWKGLEGMRLKTIKLRGQLSQGLALPIDQFPEVVELIQDIQAINHFEACKAMVDGTAIEILGFDVTEKLGIKKWEQPIPAQLGGKVKGNFPSFIPKTDEERIQNIFRKVRQRDDEYEVTIKLDGSSMTAYMLEDNKLCVCSRNYDLAETDVNSFWKCAKEIGLEEKLLEVKKILNLDKLAIQGELMGHGVQGNREGLEQLDFYVFNMYNIEQQLYLQPDNRQQLCYLVGLKHAPVLGFKHFEFDTIEEALQSAVGESLNPNVTREGVVYKSTVSDYSFKIISNKFLMEEK